VYDAPVSEVSGACFVGDTLVVVGDAEPVLAWASWTRDGPAHWRTLDVAGLPGAPKRTGQFEAVEVLRDAVVGVLCEEPALLLAVDLDSRRLAGSWGLEVGLEGLRRSWRKDVNSRGEGLIVGSDRLYVVKEKKPAAIIEFGLPGQMPHGKVLPGSWCPPPGARLTALGYRELEASDVSDATVVDGLVWLLSDQDACLVDPDGRRTALPDGLSKAEGLARTPDGRWLVATDTGDGRAALHVLDP
jgi:hypothetical protein